MLCYDVPAFNSVHSSARQGSYPIIAAQKAHMKRSSSRLLRIGPETEGDQSIKSFPAVHAEGRHKRAEESARVLTPFAAGDYNLKVFCLGCPQ